MRHLVLICAALAWTAPSAHAQDDPEELTRWAQYVRDSLPGVRGALWHFKVVSPTLTRITLKESNGNERLSFGVRLREQKCIDPALDFENPPNLGTKKIEGFSVGYRKDANSSIVTLDACAALEGANPKRYLRITAVLLKPDQNRELLEQAIAVIYREVGNASGLVDRTVAASTDANNGKLTKSQREKLEAELIAILQQGGGGELVQRRVDSMNKEAKKQKSVDDEERLGGVFFAKASWRIALNDPSGVPAAVLAETESLEGFDILQQASNIELGALRGNYFGSVSAEFYRGDIRDDASPGVYQLVAGIGGAARSWSEGGISKVKSYSYERLDQYGSACPKWDKNEDPILREAKFRGVKCNKVRVTETTTPFYTPPGWLMGWGGVYGGIRHVRDMLAGDGDDAMRPLGNASGPVVGVTAFLRRSAYAFETSHEIAYYVQGADGMTGPSYTGRVGFGALLALMDLRLRLDSAVGKEFMVGLQIRADLFDGVRFFSR